MSESHKNMSVETKRKMSISMMGHKSSKETIKKISDRMINNKYNLGKKQSQEHIRKKVIKVQKAIFMFDDYQILEFFNSTKEAGEYIGKLKNNNITDFSIRISKCCRGKTKNNKAYGYKWIRAKFLYCNFLSNSKS